jgi:hypothetical protein
LPIAEKLIDLQGAHFSLKSKLRIVTAVIVTFPPERVMSGPAPIQADMASSRYNRPNRAKKIAVRQRLAAFMVAQTSGLVRWAIPTSRLLALPSVPRLRQRGSSAAAPPAARMAGWALRFA